MEANQKILIVVGGILMLVLGPLASAPILAQTEDHKIYLPVIFKPPPPPPILFYDDFSEANSGWRQST
jgi:hypothetical protein